MSEKEKTLIELVNEYKDRINDLERKTELQENYIRELISVNNELSMEISDLEKQIREIS